MNTANLQLEGLYVCFASVLNALVAKGALTREDVDAALASAEETSQADYRAEELSAPHRDAVAFPARILRLMINSASEREIPQLSERGKLVGQTKNEATLPQRAAGDEDATFSPTTDDRRPTDPEATMIQRKLQDTASNAQDTE